MSLTARRKVHGAHVRIYSPHTFQQTARSEPTDKNKSNLLWAVFSGLTAKLESSTSVEYQKGVLNTALHSSVIFLKVSKK